jgi:hypothetical protein
VANFVHLKESRDTFVPSKIVLKVDFLERGKKLLDKNGPKNTLFISLFPEHSTLACKEIKTGK